jgi:hypothetical protein
MKINGKISSRLDSKVEKAVFGEQRQHVIKKWDAGVNGCGAGSIDL